MSAEGVAAREDVLDLYEEPYDPKRPKVNCDAASQPRIAETRRPLPATPGTPELSDSAYQRQGTRNLCMFCAPQAGWWHMAVPAPRPRQAFAHHRPWLVDERSPEADMMRVVMDNLTTHKPASFYEAFAPADARRLVKKRALHATPKPGSWVHMAEIALSILQGQGLARRIPDEAMLPREITAYADARNAAQATIVWCFTTTKARKKLQRLYPSNSK